MNLFPSVLSAVIGVSLCCQIGYAGAPGTVAVWGGGLSNPTNMPAGLSNVMAVAAGGTTDGSTCRALKSDGKVVAWGWNAYALTNVPVSASNIVAIAAGWSFDATLRDDGIIVLAKLTCQ